ncbi:MAG: universal stress protein [Gemmatimonadaceae bacterium]
MATAMLQRARPQESALLRAAPAAITDQPLLVATDGSSPSDAALRAARAISDLTGQKVILLGVHAPMPMMGPEVQIATTPNVDAEQRAALQSRLKEQLERVGISAPWSEHVVTGHPAATIANFATKIDAWLIIMGLGGHDLFERIFGDEMVLQVLRVGTAPVLAVAESFQSLPKRALAAVDFSSSSVQALALGGALMKWGGEITLAHVLSADREPLKWSSTEADYVRSVGRTLDRIVVDAGLFGEAVRCERKVLSGDPSKQLIDLAKSQQPDLIIAGSHGHGFLSRLLIGSVSTKLLRKTGCSILIVPPTEGPEFMDELSELGRFAFYEWTERLEEFTRRNTGRLARLEVLDPDIGAQLEEDHSTFVGASLDPRDGRVQIMFGSEDGGHLTRSIGGVTAIQMLRDRNGQDAFLRVAHGRGQTLLTLER